MDTEIMFFAPGSRPGYRRKAKLPKSKDLFGQPTPERFVRSLRIPVTAANRDYLRQLRAAELKAWEGPSKQKE